MKRFNRKGPFKSFIISYEHASNTVHCYIIIDVIIDGFVVLLYGLLHSHYYPLF